MALETPTQGENSSDGASCQEDSPYDINPSLVREQLARVLACAQFKSSVKLSKFLRFVTEAALEGRAGEIKETAIGVAVYDKAPTYDPKVDTVVRTEARRLRRKLDEYFQELGQSDPVRISLPKGGYVPLFTPVVRRVNVLVEHSETQEHVVDLPVSSVETTREPVEDRDPSPKRRTLLILASLCLFVLFTGLLFLLRWHWQRSESLSASSHIGPMTSVPGESYQPSISPDGKSVAFIWNNGPHAYNIYVIQRGGQPLRVTTDDDSDFHPAWDRDGGSLAFLRASPSGSRIVLIPFPGGSEKILFSLKSARPWSEDLLGTRNDTGPAWSADGTELFVSDVAPSGQGLGLYAYNLTSGALRPITDPLSDRRDLSPAASPDGRWIAFVRFTSYDSSDIYLYSLTDHTEREVTHEHMDIQGLAWSDAGRSIIFSSNRGGTYGLWKIGLNGGEALPIETSGESAIQPAVSPDGKFLVYADSALRSNILKVSLDHPSSALAIAPATRRSHSAQFSPDGSNVAFVSDRSGKWELWTADADGKRVTQLTKFEAATVGSPRWSPDGKLIAFDARPNGHSAVFVIAADGQQLRELSPGNSEEKQPSWSPDGEWIYFDSNRDGSMRLWKMRVSGADATPVSHSSLTDAQISPDSKTLFFTTAGDGLWEMPSNGGKETMVQGLERSRFGRLWTVTEHGIYFVDTAKERSSLRFYDFKTGVSKSVMTLPVDPLVGFPSLSYSPTQKAILFAAKEEQHSDLMTLWWK
ncbi:hypothetical protein [Acidicapsa ligni]|uniref:hypothetical protein n=1 Tax=Acidicapsa ligni TaxID=542300 RepID=UPI0021E0A767|nr:hypothetical protein [Acidicapsa ligni]